MGQSWEGRPRKSSAPFWFLIAAWPELSQNPAARDAEPGTRQWAAAERRHRLQVNGYRPFFSAIWITHRCVGCSRLSPLQSLVSARADRSTSRHSAETLPLPTARVATARAPRSWRAARPRSASAACPPCAPARASRPPARSSRRWSPRGSRSPLQATSIASSWAATRATAGWRRSPVAVVLQVGVNAPSLYVARMLASCIIARLVAELGSTPYGSFPAKSLRRPSASATVAAIGVGSEPFAMLSLAGMSLRARSRLASPPTRAVRSVSSSAWA